jgi:hypothetical protein
MPPKAGRNWRAIRQSWQWLAGGSDWTSQRSAAATAAVYGHPSLPALYLWTVPDCDFDGILCDIKVHKVWEGGVFSERIGTQSPSIRMLGLQYNLDSVTSLLVDVIWPPFPAPPCPVMYLMAPHRSCCPTKYLLVEGF